MISDSIVPSNAVELLTVTRHEEAGVQNKQGSAERYRGAEITSTQT